MEQENIISPIQFLNKLKKLFKANANAEEAKAMSKYMKFLFPFVGIKKPLRKELTRPLMAVIKQGIDENWLLEAVELLWSKSEREYHYVAIELLKRYAPKHLGEHTWPQVEVWLTQKSWWDSVDAITSYVASPMALKFPSVKQKLKSYITHKNFWLKRVAIIHQLPYYENTDVIFLKEACLKNAEDKEFFIRKAIGWALRQYARTSPDWVKQFVREHHDRLSSLSIREALKHHVS